MLMFTQFNYLSRIVLYDVASPNDRETNLWNICIQLFVFVKIKARNKNSMRLHSECVFREPVANPIKTYFFYFYHIRYNRLRLYRTKRKMVFIVIAYLISKVMYFFLYMPNIRVNALRQLSVCFFVQS